MTIHNEAKKEDIARVVLMPGDPLRAQGVATTFLQETRCVNTIRNMLTYTGMYKNQRITIMPHGMGIPSVGIYSYELMKFYDVDYIIRVGSCLGLANNLKIGSVIISEKAYSESTYAKMMGLKVKNKILFASSELVHLAENVAQELAVPIFKGLTICSDCFYQKAATYADLVKRYGAIAKEMEAFGLYANALLTKKQAVTLLTVADSLTIHESLTPEQRHSSFVDMMKLALEMGVKLLGENSK